MSLLVVLLLAVVQGAAELLPVSSSAHVILVEKLLGLDPSAPELTFLLVMLHTGTMLAVLVRYWPRWRELLRARQGLVTGVVVATAITGVLGLGLKLLIEKVVLHGAPKQEIEELFRNLPLMAASLAAVGVLILVAGHAPTAEGDAGADRPLTPGRSAVIGLVQGLCLPFRGFSRSGATISTGLLLGEKRARAEDLSFALAVVLTPPVIALELHRLLEATGHGLQGIRDLHVFGPGLVGLAASFVAGLLALKLLAAALEKGRWKLFGVYCLVFSAVVLGAHFALDREPPKLAQPAATASH